MPLSSEQKARLRALTGADESATEDVLMSKAIEELDAQKADLETAAGRVTALSASVATLTDERDNHKAKVLSLSAGTAPTDPMVLSLMGDQFDARQEAAIEAGAPKAAVDYFATLIRDNTGMPSPLALSACAVPAGEGKTKSTNMGAAILDGLVKLYKGTFGTGVQPGHVKPEDVLRLSAGGDDKAPTPERMAELRDYAQLPAAK